MVGFKGLLIIGFGPKIVVTKVVVTKAVVTKVVVTKVVATKVVATKVVVTVVAKWEALPTCSLVAISYHNNFVIDRTLRQTRKCLLLYLKIFFFLKSYLTSTVSLMRLRTKNSGNKFFFSELPYVTSFYVLNIAG